MKDNVWVDVNEIIKECEIVVRLTGVRRFDLRLWLFVFFLRLAVWILGAGLKIEEPIAEANP